MIEIISNIASAIATIIIAYFAYRQIRFIKFQNKPILQIVKLTETDYRIKNIGSGTAKNIIVSYNNTKKNVPTLQTDSQIEIILDIDLEWYNTLHDKKNLPEIEISYEDIYSHKYQTNQNLSNLEFHNSDATHKLKFSFSENTVS